MARSFRFYLKKRGHRSTASKQGGRAGEAVFFAVCCLIGFGGLVAMFSRLVMPEFRANYEFQPADCVVLAKRLGRLPRDDGTLYRPEINIEYQLRGETYRVLTYDVRGSYRPGEKEQQAALDRFTVGRRYPCWYDPADPKTAVLVRSPGLSMWLPLAVPISFLLIGGGGLFYAVLTWGKSVERRAALARQTARLRPFAPRPSAADAYPHVPTDARITDSPGTVLAFRLPVAGSPAWSLCVTLLAALIWNGVVSVFAGLALNGHLRGQPDWTLTLFTIPFELIGLGLVALFAWQMLLATRVGPTLVEISDQPLFPGGRYRLFLHQAGRLRMSWLEVLMVCEEEATYRPGSDTRTETRRVCALSLVRREDVEIRHGVPLETECDLEVPAEAMHSFRAGHNEIRWKILVRGSVVGWRPFERSFVVIVYPGVDQRLSAGPAPSRAEFLKDRLQRAAVAAVHEAPSRAANGNGNGAKVNGVSAKLPNGAHGGISQPQGENLHAS